MSTNATHLSLVDLSSLFCFRSRGSILLLTLEAPRIHYHSPGHLPVTGTRHVEANDMSPKFVCADDLALFHSSGNLKDLGEL